MAHYYSGGVDALTGGVDFIPFNPNDTPEIEDGLLAEDAPFDIKDGDSKRLAQFEAAWNHCLERSQQIIRRFHASVIGDLSLFVQSAYKDDGLVLPYPEIPTAVITGGDFSSTSMVIDSLDSELQRKRHIDDDEMLNSDKAAGVIDAAVCHLSPQDCTSLVSATRNLIAGFINKEWGEEDDEFEIPKKRQGVTPLSNVDMSLLEGWFLASQRRLQTKPKLVVVFHNFESFDSTVIRDLFHICSLYVPRLPFVFALGLPTSAAYLRANLPVATLSKLRVYVFRVKGSMDQFEAIVQGIFLEPTFDAKIHITESVVEFLVDTFVSQKMTLNSLLSSIQLVFLHHYYKPLSILIEDISSLWEDTDGREELRSLTKYLRDHFPESFGKAGVVKRGAGKSSEVSQDDALLIIKSAAVDFQRYKRRLILAYGLLRGLHLHLKDHGVPSVGRIPLVETMRNALSGNLDKVVYQTASPILNMQWPELYALAQYIHRYFYSLPDESQALEGPSCELVQAMLTTVESRLQNPQVSAGIIQASTSAEEYEAKKMHDWISQYFKSRFLRPESCRLHEIWCAEAPEQMTDLLNPSLRSSITTALTTPHHYLQRVGRPPRRKAPAKLPDTSLLFQRYRESGRMINLYDWFESFAVGVQGNDASTSSKSNGQPSRELQARFVRSMHELDLLGLLKQTGRKKDHVIRSIVDLAT